MASDITTIIYNAAQCMGGTVVHPTIANIIGSPGDVGGSGFVNRIRNRPIYYPWPVSQS